MTTTKHIYADFGNSRAKFLLPGDKFIVLDYNSYFKYNFTKLIHHNVTLVYSTVNKKADNFLTSILQPELLINSHQLLNNQSLIDISNVSGIGSDRLLGLLGGLSKSSSPIITIDCGTATTINVLDKNNAVLGGLILPGVQLQEKALRKYTSGLKKWTLSEPESLIGNDTSKAISSGIINGLGFAVSSAIRSIISANFPDDPVNIFLTGGSLSLILSRIDVPFPVIQDEALVLKGLKFLFES